MLLPLAVTLFAAIFLSFKFTDATESNGFLIIDSNTFEKVINKFDTTLVKFDSNYPSKEKHEAFVQVAKDLANVDGLEDMIAAHVDIEKKGMILNQDLVTKYELQDAIFQEKLPNIFLFVKNKDTAAPTNESHHIYKFEEQTRQNTDDFSPDAIKNFIRQKSGIYFALSGCIDEFDFIAMKFMNEFTKFKKESVIAEAETEIIKIPEEEAQKKADAELYVELMKQAVDADESKVFLTQEMEKSNEELADETLTDAQKKKTRQILNILESFQLASRYKMVEAPVKDEL